MKKCSIQTLNLIPLTLSFSLLNNPEQSKEPNDTYGELDSPTKIKKIKEKRNTHQEALQALEQKKQEVQNYERIYK